MAKNAKKAGTKDKEKPKKAASKPLGKSAKPSKPMVKTLVSAVQKMLGKPAKDAKKEGKKESKKAKKNKKQDDELDLGDDLVGDDEMGAEEIPDLAEFEEIEIEETEELEVEGAEVAEPPKPTGDEEVVLTDAEGRRYCRVRDCDQISAVEGYCRFHYLQLWKKIQVRRKILTDGKLQRYVEELTSRYPDKFLEMIRKDLRNEKDFLTAIAELEIDESAIDNEFEDEAQNFIDEVRGISEGSGISDEQEEF